MTTAIITISVGAPDAEGEPDAHKSGGEPHDGGEEAECFGGFPTTTGVGAVGVKMPVPDTAAVQLVDGIDENAESGEPSERNDNIKWPREEARRERYQPY